MQQGIAASAVVRQGITGSADSAAAPGPATVADLAAVALVADDLPGFSVSAEQATEYPGPGTGAFLVRASYASAWLPDPATDTSVPLLAVALFLHSSVGEADALLAALPRSLGTDPDLTSVQDLGPQGLGEASLGASLTVQHADAPAQQFFSVAFRRGRVSLLIIGSGSLDQLTAYAQLVDQRLTAAAAACCSAP